MDGRDGGAVEGGTWWVANTSEQYLFKVLSAAEVGQGGCSVSSKP